MDIVYIQLEKNITYFTGKRSNRDKSCVLCIICCILDNFSTRCSPLLVGRGQNSTNKK